MDDLSWLTAQQIKGNLRRLIPVERNPGGLLSLSGKKASPLLDFSSNDYLALSTHHEVISSSRRYLELAGSGAGAARLMSGNLAMYDKLEKKVAELKGQESALLFGSGYMANCGVIPALVGRGDVIFTDRLNHASIYDGCLLSRAKLVRFHHNDMNHLEEQLGKHRGHGKALIIVESLYSMDGDRCPLRDVVQLKEKYQCLLMVDEAHATGVFGKNGGGIIEEEGVADKVDIAMGTFGKALGSYGAYIAASEKRVQYLINRARTFIYSTGLPPSVIGASLAGIKITQEQPQLRRELHEKVALFKAALQQAGVTDTGPSQIIPILIGESAKAVDLAEKLREMGIFATAVRPPTVPDGTARLRFSITRHLSDEALEQTAASLVSALGM
ncbi:MAG: 8-amino-7-oxononanoate synthase [Desulfobulbaceae bacterium]|nr:8-amino-7-oxononanoate synthase [Desulfobulbaceae bacterium]